MNPKRPTHKNIFFSYEGLRKYFLPAHFVNPVQDYYICKPIAGLLTTSVNFFQDESIFLLGFSAGLTEVIFPSSAKP